MAIGVKDIENRDPVRFDCDKHCLVAFDSTGGVSIFPTNCVASQGERSK